MLARLALFALALGVLPTAAQTPTPVLDGRLVVEVPEGLDRLTEAQLLAKYGAARKPADGFGDAILAVTVTATAMALPTDDADLGQVVAAFRQQLGATYADAEWLRAEVDRSGYRPVGVLDVWLPVGSGRVRNVMVLVALGDALGVVAANASEAAEPGWREALEAAVASVRHADA